MAALPSRFDYVSAQTGVSRAASPLKLAMLETVAIETPPAAYRGLPTPGAGFRRLEPTPDLLADLAAASQRLETATPEGIISWGVEQYAPYLTMATAFGPEGCVILSMLAKIAPDTYVFNLETGYQFQETLDLRDRIAEKYGIEVDLLQPELSVTQYEALHGGPLYRTNPNQCCFDRKIKTLERASAVMHAWMSGIRRDQSADRAQAPIVGWDKKFGLVKISPLANWTKKDVWKRITDAGIPYNPLHDKGYPSIGCWPCTRAVEAGETDERAGRWSGMRKTECGLHTISEQDGSGI
ncbi:MAG TPA: phosphoadenylyl-sulfate reductase [Lacipirellulaceae bacterium]|nr:phosphoadenylyl-sulfate reductase [Lacipirellulaceae bacterium]